MRQLERALAKVLRKVGGGPGLVGERRCTSTPTARRSYLGRPRFTPESAERTAVPGVATGLAVTGAGGDVLFIEATAMDGEPGLTLTGQLGDVMKESVSIALSYLRGRAELAGLDLAVEEAARARAGGRGAQGRAERGRHDDDRAGVAGLRAGRCGSTSGMTGEVTLQGRVLPIGGVKQKLLAAHRAGLTDVIIPKRNEPDL